MQYCKKCQCLVPTGTQPCGSYWPCGTGDDLCSNWECYNLTKDNLDKIVNMVEPDMDYKDKAIKIAEILMSCERIDLDNMPDALMAPRAWWDWFEKTNIPQDDEEYILTKYPPYYK